jgi:hypothetical protein
MALHRGVDSRDGLDHRQGHPDRRWDGVQTDDRRDLAGASAGQGADRLGDHCRELCLESGRDCRQLASEAVEAADARQAWLRLPDAWKQVVHRVAGTEVRPEDAAQWAALASEKDAQREAESFSLPRERMGLEQLVSRQQEQAWAQEVLKQEPPEAEERSGQPA